MESWEDKRERLFNRDKLRCRRCQRQTSSLSLHHIIPRELYGSDDDDNLITLCNSCHDWVELNLAFEPLLRTRTGIINSLPTLNYRIVAGQFSLCGYPQLGDRADIWALWVKQGRKGSDQLIVKYGVEKNEVKPLSYKPKLIGTTVKNVEVSAKMTKEQYNKMMGLV